MKNVFGKKRKRKKSKNTKCVSFWVEPSIIERYQELYPSTLSKYVRYCLVQALHNDKLVINAITEKPKKKTIFS